jgi:epoxyqueuosine reductase
VEGLTGELKRRARCEGFDLVGVAAAQRARGGDALRRWLDQGLHGEMAYLERTSSIRDDPSHLLPGCRSVVAVAMSYRCDQPDSRSFPDNDGRAWVSRYAWGRDYHRLMRKRLVRLGRWLAECEPGCEWRACVDTAPILEREWAFRAGIGWIGKNTMLLNRELGSELFLGLLLTDITLEPDRPATEHCGRCRDCLDACPTDAFPSERVLDARRCIGYLTVEHRSSIPDELGKRMGSMVAGCDICQEVCPWTRRAPMDRHPEFAPRAGRFRPLIEDLEAFDEDGYRSWREGSALKRISFDQFRRNLQWARRNQKKHSRTGDEEVP